MLLYICINIVFVYAVPPEEMKGVISIGGLAMGKLFGPSVETVFSLLISFALFSSLSAFIILGPRVYYSMAKDRLFFKGLVTRASDDLTFPPDPLPCRGPFPR